MTSSNRENGAEVSVSPNSVPFEGDHLMETSASDPSLERAIQLLTHSERNGGGQSPFIQGTGENKDQKRSFNPNLSPNGNYEEADTETPMFPMNFEVQVSSDNEKSIIDMKDEKKRDDTAFDSSHFALSLNNEEQSFLEQSDDKTQMAKHLHVGGSKSNAISDHRLKHHSTSPMRTIGTNNNGMEKDNAIILSNSGPTPITEEKQIASGSTPCTEYQDNSATRMPPQSRGPLHTDLNENTFNEGWMRQTKEAALYIDISKAFDKSAVKHDYRELDQLKSKLYLESVRSHRGRGAERQFADYWYAIGCYIVSEKTGNSRTIRSGSDPCANGIEGVLNSFLKTKRLRRLHNKLIRTLLKQSLQTVVPKKRFQSHIPRTWDSLIELLMREHGKDIQGAEKPLVNTKTPFKEGGIFKKDSSYTAKFEEVFGTQAGLSTGVGSDESVLLNLQTSLFKQNWDQSNRASDKDQYRLPGLLEIEPIVEKLAKKDKIVVSGSALGLMTVAIRNYISGILKNAITLAEEQLEEKTQTNTDENTINPDKRGDTLAKSKSISSFDLMRSLSYKPKKGYQLPSTRIKSRIAWERCVSGVSPESRHTKRTKVAEIQQKLNDSILSPNLKLQENLILKRRAADLAKSIEEKKSNDSTKRRRAVRRHSSRGAGGSGKDLQAMKARLDSRQNSDLSSSKGSKRPTTPGSQLSEGNASGTYADRNKGGKDLNQMRNRSVTSSPGSSTSGRGRGFKDLESMRNRNNGSSLSRASNERDSV